MGICDGTTTHFTETDAALTGRALAYKNSIGAVQVRELQIEHYHEGLARHRQI